LAQGTSGLHRSRCRAAHSSASAAQLQAWCSRERGHLTMAMKRLALTACLVATTAEASAEIFASVKANALFGACVQTLKNAAVPGTSFLEACSKTFSAAVASQSSLADDCAELGGRAAEASSQGYLNDGRLVCGLLVREHASVSGNSLAGYMPESASRDSALFCNAMQNEVLTVCKPSGSELESDAAPASRPVSRQIPALSASQPQPVAPQVSPRQALRHAGKTAQATHAEAPVDLANGNIWTNLEALLHRTG